MGRVPLFVSLAVPETIGKECLAGAYAERTETSLGERAPAATGKYYLLGTSASSRYLVDTTSPSVAK